VSSEHSTRSCLRTEHVSYNEAFNVNCPGENDPSVLANRQRQRGADRHTEAAARRRAHRGIGWRGVLDLWRVGSQAASGTQQKARIIRAAGVYQMACVVRAAITSSCAFSACGSRSQAHGDTNHLPFRCSSFRCSFEGGCITSFQRAASCRVSWLVQTLRPHLLRRA